VVPTFSATVSFSTNRGAFSYEGLGQNKKNARRMAALTALRNEQDWKED
jgi:hypothetical protein